MVEVTHVSQNRKDNFNNNNKKNVFDLILIGKESPRDRFFIWGPKELEVILEVYLFGPEAKICSSKRRYNVSLKMDYKKPNRIKLGSEDESW